jgi:hypothetical protein
MGLNLESKSRLTLCSRYVLIKLSHGDHLQYSLAFTLVHARKIDRA